MKKYLIVGNWKMNPLHPHDAYALASAIEAESVVLGKNVDVVICPPFPYLTAVGTAIKKIKLGAQDVFWEDTGAYTGEVSPSQLNNIGVSYVIVGHSERKEFLKETDEMINKKTKTALERGLYVILCVGEKEREEGGIPALVGDQIRSALDNIKKNAIKNLVIAYEPVWAISTNTNAKPDTPDNAFRASLFIRKIIADLYDRKTADSLSILYGGSVRKENIASFLMEGNMQGALVGGASLDAREFTEIVRIAASSKRT